MIPSLRDLEKCPGGLALSISLRMEKGRTSARLGVATLRALYEIADREGSTVNDLCSRIAAARLPQETFTEALRSYVVNYFREAATEDGHRRAGHGLRARRK